MILKTNDFQIELSDNDGFVTPVVIEAIPAFADCEIRFFVHTANKFAPKRFGNGPLKFQKVKQANKFINKVLKPRWGDNFTFEIWSKGTI